MAEPLDLDDLRLPEAVWARDLQGQPIFYRGAPSAILRQISLEVGEPRLEQAFGLFLRKHHRPEHPSTVEFPRGLPEELFCKIALHIMLDLRFVHPVAQA